MDSWDEARMNQLRTFCQAKEISSNSIIKLRLLEDFDIVCVCDDSGSMNAALNQGTSSDAFGKKMTRWDELCHAVQFICEVATALDKNGIDVFFLNRPGVVGVFSTDAVKQLFVTPPHGYTPTVAALKNVLTAKAESLKERKVLLILLTDGQPTDTNGNVQIDEFVLFIRQKPATLFVSIVACTDDKSVLNYLDQLDSSVPNIDVCDDFHDEKQQVLQKTGVSLSYGDYICKIMLGSVDPSFDKLDESTQQQSSDPSSCCLIC